MMTSSPYFELKEALTHGKRKKYQRQEKPRMCDPGMCDRGLWHPAPQGGGH